MRILELFGGIGAFTHALKRLNIPVEVVDYVEIDKYANTSYNAMNGTSFPCKDIRHYSGGVRMMLT
jgi:DNA (cytosine-5)-methyltransferase 1